MQSELVILKEVTRLIIIALLTLCCFWILVPRTWHYGDTNIIYPVKTASCNQYNVCDVEHFLEPVKLRVNEVQSKVVWLKGRTGEIGTWDECAIIDKLNWHCGGVASMTNGRFESRHPSVHFVSGGDWDDIKTPLSYISGWSYRLYWLLSFLPDLR